MYGFLFLIFSSRWLLVGFSSCVDDDVMTDLSTLTEVLSPHFYAYDEPQAER